MIFFWVFLISLSGILMGFAHHFRMGEIEINPSWWTLILTSIGIAVFMKVSSLRSRKRARFGLGFLGGFIYFAITLYWISIALREFGNLNIFVSVFASLLLSAYCAIFYGFWALLAGFERVREKPIFLRIFIWASLWAGLEALREYLLTGFPWGEIGYSFSDFPLIGKMASVWGVHGLSFLWIFVISLLLHLDEWTNSKRLRFAGAAWLILFFTIGFAGSWYARTPPTNETVRFALIQPNISQGMKWDPEMASLHLRRLLDLSQDALKEDPDLIVWPETSYPFLVAASQRQLPFSSPVPSLLGAVVSNRRVNFNSALFVKDDQIQARFDKVHLVPFGEYVPLEDWLPFGKLVENTGRFLSGGKDQELFQLEDGAKLGPLICYEDIFSRHSVRLIRDGADILVNITNDAWYGESSAQKQHSAMAKMRVYETATPMVRATNTGHTTAFEFESSETIPMEEAGVMTAGLSLPKPGVRTFFTWTHPLMEWIWWIIFAICFGWKVPYQKKKIFFREP